MSAANSELLLQLLSDSSPLRIFSYGRLLTRIKSKLSHTLRTTVRTILQWVTCARRPLREEEILQVLAIEPDKADFTKGRKEFRDICKACGPIIEINESTVQFVHFSAKE